MKLIDIIGLIASAIIVSSMVFKTTTFKGTVAMRIVNSIGCIFFIIYGFTLPDLATGIANAALLILNIVYLFVEVRAHGKQKAKS